MRSNNSPPLTLGDLVDFRNGISFSGDQKGRGIPIVGVGDFVDPVLTSDRSLERVDVGDELPESAFIQPQDLLFVRSNGSRELVGRALLVQSVEEPTTHAGFTIRARPYEPDEWSEFLWHYFQSGMPLQLMRRFNGGTNITNLNQDLLAGLPVPDLDASTRHRVCDMLRQWDRASVLLDRLINAKGRLRDGLAQALLTGRRRLPAFAGRAWREVWIGEVMQEVHRPVEWDDEAVYDLVSVRRWAGGVYTRQQLRGGDIKVKKLRRIQSGDILISHIQSAYGAMAMVGDDHDGHCVSDLYTVLVPRRAAKIVPRYFAWQCRTRWMWHQAYVSSNGFLAERLRVNFDPATFLERVIRLPESPDEQSAIADILDAATREIDALMRLRQAVAKQKRGLMQQLLTGRLRVPEETSQRREASS